MTQQRPSIPSARAGDRTVQDIVNARRIISGPADKFRAASQVRYPWAQTIFKLMRDNNWDVHQVNFKRDKEQFPLLPVGMQTAFLRALAFLSNLDAIQVDNLSTNVVQIITDPTIRQCLHRQTYEEAIHEEAYSVMIEEVVPERTLDVYDMYRRVAQLGSKNDYIINKSREVTVDPTEENKVKAIVSNLGLEGIFFYTGFLQFYNAGRVTGMMQGSISNIEYIQRDEITHVGLFRYMFQALRAERPDLFTPDLLNDCREILIRCGELETEWGYFVIEDGVDGLTKPLIRDYARTRVDAMLAEIEMPLEYRCTDPFPWAKKHEKINDKQKNFFETKVVTYTESTPEFKKGKSRRNAGTSDLALL